METTHTARLSELDGAEARALAVDGVAPRYVTAPRSVDELASVLREATERRWAVAPRGGGSKTGRGNPPRALDVVIEMGGLAGLVEYTPADMTVTVRAGTRLADLQRELAANGQALALDPPFAARATIGGILATNDSGPRRLGYGTARDVVIGTRVAAMDGRVTRAGGNVVKNVTGYDLNKLYIGSLGTLTVLAEVSFKLHPLPGAARTVTAVFRDTADAMKAVSRLLRSPLGPLALALTDADPGALTPDSGALTPETGSPWRLYVEFTGTASALARKTGDALEFCREAGAQDVVLLDEGEEPWEVWREHPTTYGLPRGLRLKLVVPVTAVAGLIDAARAGAREAGIAGRVLSFASNGIIYAYYGGGTTQAQDGLVRELRRHAGAVGGALVVEESSLALKGIIDVWGDAPSGFGVMKRLKETYDPLGLLNPGRYMGGL